MKQIIRLLVLAALLAALFVPSAAFASDKAGGGVYIAPKFIYGVTRLDGIKLYHASGAYTAESKQTEGAFGGALAIGFDFNRRPRILGEGTGPSISAAEERALWVA
ncbi:MAG: hypothetical protein FWH25_01560, partial [Syntrophorhabdaceae bacterium]|nr:hypothetical protein [Syntrophorhabdaceae bacterium]